MSNTNLIKEYISLLIESRRVRLARNYLKDLNLGVIERMTCDINRSKSPKSTGEYFIVLYDINNPNIVSDDVKGKEFIKIKNPSGEDYENFICIDIKSSRINRDIDSTCIGSRVIKSKSYDPIFLYSTIERVKKYNNTLLKSAGYEYFDLNNLGTFILLDSVKYISIEAKTRSYYEKFFESYYSEDQRLRAYKRAGFTGVLKVAGSVSDKVHEFEMNSKLSENIDKLIDSIIEDGSDKIKGVLYTYATDDEELTLEQYFSNPTEGNLEEMGITLTDIHSILKRCLTEYYNDTNNKPYVNPDYKTITLNEIEYISRSASYLAALPFIRKDKNKDRRDKTNLGNYALGQIKLSQPGMTHARRDYRRGKEFK